jgi:hypothetical protein
MAGDPLSNPFLALRSFRREDADRFFGRDADLVLLRSRLYSARATLLFAGSGVGKTSFLDARLTPALEREWLIVTHRDWAARAPLEGVQRAIAAAAPSLGVAALAPADQIDRITKASSAPRECLVVLDQFEEVFQNWRESKVLDEFAAEIARIVHAPGLEARVLLSMREEFLGELGIFDNLIPELFNNCYRLKNPTRSEAEEIIRKTVMVAHRLQCGDGLDALLDDLLNVAWVGRPSTRAEASVLSRVPMPFLQIVCYRLWERQLGEKRPEGMPPPKEFLETAPGPASAELDAFCREILKERLTLAEQDLACAAFGFLMTPSGAKMAYPVDVLATQIHAPEHRLYDALHTLSAPDVRILREIASGPEQPPWFELYHDQYSPFLSAWRREHEAARSRRQQRTRWAALGGVAVVAAALALAVYHSMNVEAFAQQLLGAANQARTVDGTLTSQSLLLTAEAFALAPDRARDALKQAAAAPLIEMGTEPTQGSGVIAFSPKGSVLCSTSSNDLRLIDVGSGREIATVHREATITAVAFSPDGATLAVVGWDGKLALYAAGDARLIEETPIAGPSGTLQAVAYNTAGDALAVGGDDGTHPIALVRSAKPQGTILWSRSFPDGVTDVDFSPDGKELLVAAEDGVVTRLDASTGKERAAAGGKQRSISVDFTPSGRLEAVATRSTAEMRAVGDHSSKGVDLAVGLRPNQSLSMVRFSRGSGYLAIANSDGEVSLWEVSGGEPLTHPGPALISSRATVLAIDFTRDDGMIAVGGNNGAYLSKVLHSEADKSITPVDPPLTHLDPGASVRSVVFDSTGQYFASRTNDRVRFFRIATERAPLDDPGALQRFVCKLAGRGLTSDERAKYLSGRTPEGCTGR